jgi:signal transduction histidine kinase
LRGENILNINKLKLKWKIFAFLLGFCALLLAILWLFQTTFLDSFYKQIRIMEIKNNANTITNNIQNNVEVQSIIEDSKNNDVSIDIVNLNGHSLLIPFELQDRHNIEENSKIISQALGKGKEHYEYTKFPPAPLGRRPMMQSLIYVKLTDSQTYGRIAVVMRAVISPVDATVTTLRYQLYVISGIMLILSIILAFIIAKRVSKPIEEISHSALSLANGNYNTHFEGKGFYEIVALSEILNTAAHELGKVDNLRRELLANVSHDLRTPLALIYSYAEMMNDFPGEITLEQTQVIIDESKRLTSLVNDILDISKLESDMEQLNISNFNLTQNILDTCRRMEVLLKNEGFKINFSYDRDIFINADKMKIDRVFYNLIINGINYSGESKLISISQKISKDFVRVSITDNGSGIAEDELPFIWDRYYKSNKNHKRAVTGTGLGLSIVKKIMDLHEGKYGVTSEIDNGSTFWFEINI